MSTDPSTTGESSLPDDVPVIDTDYYAPESLLDPVPVYTELRESGPFAYLGKYGVYATGRHDEVKAVLSDWETFCSYRGFGLGDLATQEHWREPSVILEVDPPRHDEVKRVLMKVLSNRAIQKLADDLKLEAVAMVDRISALGEFDAVRELSEAYTIKVMSDAIGIDDDDRRNLVLYGSMVFNSNGPMNAPRIEAFEAGEKVSVVDWIMARCERSALASGSFGQQIYEFAEDGSLSETEALRLVRMFLSAGIDTTSSGLGYTVLALARDTAQWRLLADDPSLARWAFEESIRRDPPIHTYYRTTTREVEISGATIPEGRKVMVSLGAAGRDPRVWDEPDRFDIERKPTGHLAFGRGVHMCAGLAIARMQADALLGTLAEKIDRIELAGDPVFKANNSIATLERLPVRVFPR